MNFLQRIAVLFYVTMALFISVFVLMFVTNYIDIQNVYQLFALVYTDETIRIITAASAVFLLLLNYIFYKTFSVSNRKGGVIAFENPSGRVNVSLAALEDMIKRVISKTPEVKEIKSKIAASKKGLVIRITLILRAEGSIPEVTSHVQELVKKRVQSAIGLDEPIDVIINVGKILSDGSSVEKRPSKKEESKDAETNVPFPGYRA